MCLSLVVSESPSGCSDFPGDRRIATGDKRTMSTKIKICGITNLKDALDAVELGADYLGFNFYPDSPRFIDPRSAASILEEIPSNVGKVGVFVNADGAAVMDVVTELNLDLVQFHGDEPPVYCRAFARPVIKAIRPRTGQDLELARQYDVDYLLIDAFAPDSYGGTGTLSNWDFAKQLKAHRPLFLSGGLTVENVEAAVATVHPFAVDVASGVEVHPGKKDYGKMEEFIEKARRAGNVRVVK